jgi:thioredoxin reductase (NADPH)
MVDQSPVMADCLVIGGGPAGLTLALYLVRFRRRVILCDAGNSRANLILHSFNYPGFTNGISGKNLIKNLRIQAKKFGAILKDESIKTVEQAKDGFISTSETSRFISKKVVLATGIVDRKPLFPDIKEFIYQGAIRFCPVCDGYEAIGKSIGVVGPFEEASAKAFFLRTYSNDITLFINEKILPADKVEELSAAGIKIVQGRLRNLKLASEKVSLVLEDNSSHAFDVLYPSMGYSVRSELAQRIGAQTDEEGYIITDHDQMTGINGFYAVGDVVKDLSQICVGAGQAAIAAAAIHKALHPVYAS